MEYIQKLDPTEKERYVDWHKEAIKEDLACAEKLQDISPRNAIVLGYYAMHNCAKKYLGEVHNIRFIGTDIHNQTCNELKKKIQDKATREEIIYLMTEAMKKYSAIAEPDAIAIPRMLEIGKKKRGTASYYSSGKGDKKHTKQEYEDFNDLYVKPFIAIVDKLEI